MNQPNYKIIDSLLQFILATASLNDDRWDRELGMIHLIKYTYLADYQYAKYHNGQTYTGIKWIFYHYGPWDVCLYKRIEPSLKEISAEKKIIESYKYDNDIERWVLQNTDLFTELEEKIDIVVSGAVQKYVKKFGSDTSNLLDFVYKTEPMLNAAPEDTLDFSHIIKTYQKNNESVKKELTTRQKKKFKQKFEDLKLRIKHKKKKKRIQPEPPRYDDVFYEAVEYLDSLAGKQIEDSTGKLIISNDMWYSKARYNLDEF